MVLLIHVKLFRFFPQPEIGAKPVHSKPSYEYPA